MRTTTVGLLVVGALLAGPAAATAEVPEPPLVLDADATDGQVRLDPPTQSVDGGRVTWVLTNGGTDRLEFDLVLHEVTDEGPDGVRVGEPVTADALARPMLRLGPGEAARIPVTVEPTPPRALALVATTVDAEPETSVSGIVLVGGGGQVRPDVTGTDPDDGSFTVRLDADGPTLVDVALRATAWPGTPSSATVVEGVYVPAGGREIDVEVAGLLAGRVTIDVATGDDTAQQSRTTVWWWPVWALVALAVVLGLVVVAVVLLLRRRRAGERDVSAP